MEFTEEDSYAELSAIMAALREADMHAIVHEKAVIFHQNAMEHAKASAEVARQLGRAQRRLYRVRRRY